MFKFIVTHHQNNIRVEAEGATIM